MLKLEGAAGLGRRQIARRGSVRQRFSNSVNYCRRDDRREAAVNISSLHGTGPAFATPRSGTVCATLLRGKSVLRRLTGSWLIYDASAAISQEPESLVL